jgi:hypothetical protein
MAAGIEFEHPVKTESGNINFIDVLWSGVVLIEHKSAGKNLDDAEKQARDYLVALPTSKRPPTLVLSDFKRIRIIEVLKNESFEFPLKDLPEHLDRLEMVVGKHAQVATKAETTADQEAVQLMANLFVEFEKAGYEGHEVSVLLVRLLFLNFGDDTRMWKRIPGGLFGGYVANSAEDGTGLGGQLQELFQILDTPKEKRSSTISDKLVDFPYVNGGIFKEVLPVFSFNRAMRDALIKTTEYDWSKISPAIFGAMFQTVKSKEDRRHLGEHYTSEENILKVIRPLFLDDLNERLMKNWDSIQGLKKLKIDLGKNHYLDPACGSGNFLVVAYKRLRELELKLTARLQELEGNVGDLALDGTWGLSVTLDQFHGIEINEWSSQIATVAMYLADHQANLEMEAVTGSAPTRFPLSKTANIVHANALRIDWKEVCPSGDNTYVMGNPPFLGSSFMSLEQKSDVQNVWDSKQGTGNLDYVTCWFLLAAKYFYGTNGTAAFVSTNSITQGQQPSVLWKILDSYNTSITFAHKTFAWSNESSGKAAVHCVVMGLCFDARKTKRKLWTYESPTSVPILNETNSINAYLLPTEDILIESRTSPLSPQLPKMIYGSKPTDGGFLSNLSIDECEFIKSKDPIAAKFIRPLIGAQEFLNNEIRYCLWLVGVEPQIIRNSPVLLKRIEAVRKFRESSPKKATQVSAMTPHEFQEIRQPAVDYIAVPLTTSELRSYIPFAWIDKEFIASNALSLIPINSLPVFSILSSQVFNVWARVVSGRLKSDIRLSADITYNGFPLRALSQQEMDVLSKTGQAILDARENFPNSSLADLYGKNSMPPELVKAHKANDKAVLNIFGLDSAATDEEIISVLFSKYDEMTRGLLLAKPVKVGRSKA